MSAFLLRLADMTLAASCLILAILCLRKVLKRVPKRLMVLLWILPAVRLVCPLAIRSGMSLAPQSEQITYALTGTTRRNDPVMPAEVPVHETTVPSIPVTEQKTDIGPGSAMYFVWILGTVGTAGYALIRSVSLRNRVREKMPAGDEVWISDHAENPFLLGIFRPQIILPSLLSEEDRPWVLLHERTHIKRHDPLWKALGYIPVCLHWFNPLVWFGYTVFAEDLELACDEQALSGLDHGAVRSYASSLVNCGTEQRQIPVCPVSFSENAVRTRVREMLRFRKPSAAVTAMAVCLAVMLSACFITERGHYETVRFLWHESDPIDRIRSDDQIRVSGQEITVRCEGPEMAAEVVFLPFEYDGGDTPETIRFSWQANGTHTVLIPKDVWYMAELRFAETADVREEGTLRIEGAEVRTVYTAGQIDPADYDTVLMPPGHTVNDPQKIRLIIERLNRAVVTDEAFPAESADEAADLYFSSEKEYAVRHLLIHDDRIYIQDGTYRLVVPDITWQEFRTESGFADPEPAGPVLLDHVCRSCGDNSLTLDIRYDAGRLTGILQMVSDGSEVIYRIVPDYPADLMRPDIREFTARIERESTPEAGGIFTEGHYRITAEDSRIIFHLLDEHGEPVMNAGIALEYKDGTAGKTDPDVPPAVKEYYIEIPQRVQETGYYCAVACLQSVMEYHGFHASQNELAADLHTHPVTGTEYEDLARVATARIFPKGGGRYLHCIPSSDADRAVFEQRAIQDMETADPVFVSINNRIMYGDVPDQVHEVVLVGITVENGTIVKAEFFDPSYTRQDPVYGGLKVCTGDELWTAMIRNPEPGYVY